MAGKKVNRLIVPNVYTANGVEPVTSVNNILPVNGNVTIPIPTVPTNVSAFTNDAGYLTSAMLDGYATQSWVQQQGYLTSVPSQYITDTELSTTLADYVTGSSLSTTLNNYATVTSLSTETSNRMDADDSLQSQINDKYDASNPSGFISGISSSDVITALGYTPYNNSNPNGYITSAALSDYVTNTDLATTLADYAQTTDIPTVPTNISAFTNDSGYITSSALTNYVTTDTTQSISGQKTFTDIIKSSVNNSLTLTQSNGEAFGVTVKRTDANNGIKFGIGSSGDNRGIWDVRHNKWAFHVTNDGKSYALGNEIAVKSDLNSLSPLRYSRYSIASVNSTNKFIKLASMTYTQAGNRDFSYLFWVEILEANVNKCYALVKLSARWSSTSYTGHKFEILEKYGDVTSSFEALKTLTYAYSLDTTTHKMTAEIWLEIKNTSWISYYLRPTECNEYGDYSNTPVTLSDNIWTYYNQSGNASSIASTAITSGLTQVKVTDATGVRNENDLSKVIKTWTGTKAQYDAIATKNANTLYNIEGVGLYKGTTLISNDGADNTLSNVSSIDSNSAVATALNGKANTDLSNLSSTGKTVIDGKADTTLSNVSSIDSSSAVATALDGKVDNDDYYYKSGDTDSFVWVGGGYITTSATEISFTLPVPKSMANITTVTCTALTTAFRKTAGGYMPSSGGNMWNAKAKATVTVSKQTENTLSISVKYNNWGGTNNTPVGVWASISLSFT